MRVLLVLMACSLGSIAFADVQPTFTQSAGTITYSAGSITVQGTLQTINSGTLSGFTASQGSCTLASILSGTDACEYIYYPGTGTALLATTALATAMPYVIATATTDASSNVLAVNSPPLWVPFIGGSQAYGFLQTFSFENCKTTLACAQSHDNSHLLVSGTFTMSGSTAAITNLPFLNANFRCVGSAPHIVWFTTKAFSSTASVTMNGTSGDSVDWFCEGRGAAIP